MFYSCKNILLLTFLLFISAYSLRAQSVTVKGRVTDAETQEPLEFANIALMSPADSSVVSGGTGDERGNFSFTAEPGSYLLRVGFIGYKEVWKPVRIGNRREQNLGAIALASDATALREITIEGTPPLFESDIDKRTYNVENSIVAEGGTAIDVLETLPSVQVDDEGNIAMRGSGNILIYINGRPSNLAGDDTESILEQFPANSIEKIELITNPSSRYDAAGVGGIINIVLKKNARRGLNGQVNASVGTRNKYTGGINLNYANGPWNVYSNYSYQYRQLFQIGETLRENRVGGTSTFLDQNTNADNITLSHLIRSGVDFQINDNSSLGWYIQGNFRDQDRSRFFNQQFQNNFRELDSLSLRDIQQDQSRTNFETGLVYSLQLDTAGQRLLGSFSYARDRQEQTEVFEQFGFSPLDLTLPRSRILQNLERPGSSQLFIFQLDYEKPLSEHGRLEAGLKSTLSRDDRTQQFSEFNPELNQFLINDTVSNRFQFNEDVHAAFLIYRNKFGRFGYQAGLRGELTLTDSYQFTNDVTFVNNYFNLFPSLYLSYQISDQQEVQLNYSRRVSRPRLWNLMPFLNVQDPLNLRIGNPFLQPEFTNSYEASYLREGTNLFFTGTVYHRHSTDIITRIINLVDGNAAIQTFENANTRRSTGLEVINQVSLSDWFDATLTGNFFYSEILGQNIEAGLQNSNFSWTLSLLSNIRVPNVATFQVQGNYRGPIVLPQGFIRPLYGVNIGAKRDFFDRKATLSLNVSDVFNTRIFRVETEGTNFSQLRINNRETQIGTLTFTYRFGGFRDQGRDRRRGDDVEDFDDDE